MKELGIQLTKAPDAPKLPIQLKKKPIKPIKTQRKTAKDPESTITKKDMNDILSLIRHQCRTFEGTPTTFRNLEEENLRDIILSSLSAVYPGDATCPFGRRA